jgi:signal transduction histidine kinase
VRRTLRTQLTLLYAGPFVLTGAAVLGIAFLGGRSSSPAPGQGVNPDPHPAPAAHDRSVLLFYALSLVAMVVISFVLGRLVAGRFLRPLRTITATARDISATNLHRRLSLSGRGDEFADLAATLDDLFARLQASFDAQRHFVANASHELRTPLTAERTLLQVALADPHATTETLRSACQDVLALGQRQERLIEALLTLASGEQGIERREAFDLAAIAGRVVRARGEEAGRRGVHVETALAPAPAAGDPNLVESLVANLVDNALRHNRTGGHLDVTTTTTGGWARVTVQNTGPVIPPDEVEELFQPFRQLGGQRIRHTDGHGLGLAIVRAIAGAHGARLHPRARPDGGLDIDVDFPVYQTAPPAGLA